MYVRSYVSSYLEKYNYLARDYKYPEKIAYTYVAIQREWQWQ